MNARKFDIAAVNAQVRFQERLMKWMMNWQGERLNSPGERAPMQEVEDAAGRDLYPEAEYGSEPVQGQAAETEVEEDNLYLP